MKTHNNKKPRRGSLTREAFLAKRSFVGTVEPVMGTHATETEIGEAHLD